jgi:Tol biopolymer transport system component
MCCAPCPFDLAGLRLSGNPVTLMDDVYTGQGNSQTYYRLTSGGMLVYVPGRNEHSLVRVDRAGYSTQLAARRAGFRFPRLSRDGRFVSVTIDPPDEGDSDVWIFDLKRGAFSKLTRHGHNLRPVFTADGKRLAWSDWPRAVYWQAVDGSGQRERLSLMDRSFVGDFTPDGKYAVLDAGATRATLWALPLGSDEKPFPLEESKYSTRTPRFSPDGRWLAYTSDESGREEVYVRRFPRSERNWIVSTEGGTLPVWSRDGGEIFYLEGRRMMAVNVAVGAAFSAGTPVLLFDRPELTMAFPAFDVMGDGFLMVQRDPLSTLTAFHVVQTWASQSKQ